MTLRNQIARRLCVLMDDEWSQGKRLYQSETDAIMALFSNHLEAERALSDRLAEAIEAYQNATPRYDWNHGLDAALTAYTAVREEPHDKG